LIWLSKNAKVPKLSTIEKKPSEKQLGKNGELV